MLETPTRVEALCQAVGEGRSSFPHGSVSPWSHRVRGDLGSYRDQAEAILRIAEPLGVRELVVLGHVLAGSAMLTCSSMIAAEKRLSDAHARAPATPG